MGVSERRPLNSQTIQHSILLLKSRTHFTTSPTLFTLSLSHPHSPSPSSFFFLPSSLSLSPMAEEVVSRMRLDVDLQCPKCDEKVRKVLCKFPEVRAQVFDDQQNIVNITVVCRDPEKIRDKLSCEGGRAIKSIKIVEPHKDKADAPKKDGGDKPKGGGGGDKKKDGDKRKGGGGGDEKKDADKRKADATKKDGGDKPKGGGGDKKKDGDKRKGGGGGDEKKDGDKRKGGGGGGEKKDGDRPKGGLVIKENTVNITVIWWCFGYGFWLLFGLAFVILRFIK